MSLAQRCSSAPNALPLFSSLLNYRHIAGEEAGVEAPATADRDGILLWNEERTNYPLVVAVNDFGDALTLSVQAAEPIDPAQVAGLLTKAIQSVVSALAEAPAAQVRKLDVSPEAEFQQVVSEWNATARDYPLDRCVHELFEAQVARSPEAVALQFEGQSLSYRELNERANQLAHHLRTLGVRPDVLVGVCMERSVELAVALLATLKAGGAYVPLEAGYPAARLVHMIDDSRAVVVLTRTAARPALQAALALSTAGAGPVVVNLDMDGAAWRDMPRTNASARDLGVTSRNLAYVIYTSGSTGLPKGAMNEHRGAVNRIWWLRDAYGYGEGEVALQKSPFSFDVSVLEFFGPLLLGGQVVMARPDGHRDPEYLCTLIQRHRVTSLQFVPSMLEAFLSGAGAEGCHSVMRVWSGAEALPAALVARLRGLALGRALQRIWSHRDRGRRDYAALLGGRVQRKGADRAAECEHTGLRAGRSASTGSGRDHGRAVHRRRARRARLRATQRADCRALSGGSVPSAGRVRRWTHVQDR